MTLAVRVFWGFIAGLTVVCVKLIGPDREIVKAFVLAGNSGEITFYALIAFATILLGGLAALYAEDTKPLKILIFCASFPALVSTYFGATRGPTDMISERQADKVARNSAPLFTGIISAAYAQEDGADMSLICDEGSFVDQFSEAAKAYFSSQYLANSYAVVVASEKDFEQAKQTADALARRSRKYPISVGCSKPGNPYFPVMVDETSDLQTAATIKGEIIGEGWAPQDTYLSNYAYRKVIYQATRN